MKRVTLKELKGALSLTARIALITAFLLISFAQAQDHYSFSLAQAVKFALENNSAAQNAEIDEEIARQRVRETTAAGLPQINLNGNVNYFITFPTSIFPAYIFNPSAPKDLYLKAKFGMPMSSTAGVEISQLLFSGEWLISFKASREYLELSKKNIERTDIDVVAQVSKSYYLALVNKERMAMLDANIARVEKLLKDTRAMNQQGFVEKVDVDRITVTLNNLTTEKQKMQSLTEVSMYLLKFQMGMPVAANLTLTDQIRSEDLHADTGNNYSCENRIEMKMLQHQQHLLKLDIRRNQAAYLPTIAAFGNKNYQAYRADFGNIFSDPVTGRWYPNSLIGVQAKMPIFAGFGKSARVRQAKLNLTKTENDMQNLKNAIDLEVANSGTQLRNSMASLLTQEQNVKLAEEVARIAHLKYEQGVGSNLEVVTAESELKTAQTNHMNTLFEALSAQVDLQKASGTLSINR